MSPDECLNRYPTLLVDKDIQICAMGWDGTDTGLGDSGSPLMASVILLPSRNNVLRRGTLQLRIWASGLHENFSYYEWIKKKINDIAEDERKMKYKSVRIPI